MGRPVFASHCRYCCEPEEAVGQLSYRGICAGCAREAIIASNTQLSAKAGPYHERRVLGTLKRALADAERAGLTV